MLPTTTTALVVVLLAVVPGFVATTMWARARTWKGPGSDYRTTLQSLAVSLAIQVVLSPLTILWIVPIRKNLAAYPARVAVWVLLAVLVVRPPHERYVVVTFKDGSRVGGVFQEGLLCAHIAGAARALPLPGVAAR